MDQISSIDSAISMTKSASRKQTSMSSFSLESGAGAASTSGCSSLVDANRQKTLKKQRVKQCLEELRSLVKPPKGRGKGGGGTLTTLQNVITQMKKYQDVGETASNAPDTVDSDLMGSAQDRDGIHWQLSCNHNVERVDWFKVVMAMKENNVLQVPHDLLRMLRYPNNYWFNQSLMDYIYKRDIVIVNTHLNMVRSHSKQAAATSGSESTNRTEQKNIFFFRIRHYKSIRHGFSLNRSEKYTVFCGQASRQKVQLNFPPGTPVERLQADHIYPMLECTPIQSAYTSPGMLPAQSTFLMRHTLHCNYIFLHPSSIPLTGYLPQEVIGTSIFDYYHPQDLLILLGIYQQIVAMPGKTFRSIPYRMRVKNGDYIRLETEWSSFVNPWTSRIDYIIAKHHVVQGPTNLDVFNECPTSKRQTLEVSPQARSLQRHIKSALLQQVNRSSSRQPRWRLIKRRSTPRHGRTSLQPPPELEPAPLPTVPMCPPPQPEKVEASLEPSPPEPTKEQEEPDDGTPNVNILENEKLLIYEQLNYAQNIRRFLLSCAASLQGKSSSENNTESDASDQEDIVPLTVDLSLPKPPSFASSTKALVSEREQLEEMPPSPTHEDLPEISSGTSTDDDVYQPIPLTEEVITLHNRQQRQQYIEKMVREKTNLVSVQGQGLRIIKETGKAKKRVHTKDNEKPPQAPKASRMAIMGKWTQTDPSQLLYPQMPMEEQQQPTETPNNPITGNPNVTFSRTPFASNLPHQQPVTVVAVSAPTYVSVNDISNVGSNLVFCQPMTHSGTKPQLVTVENAQGGQQQHLLYTNPVSTNVNPMQMAQWPYYGTQNMQTSGMSYVPQIVYQPIPGSYFPPVTAKPMLGQSLSVAPAAAQGSPSKESSSYIEENSSLESKENPKDEEGKMAEKKSVAGSDSQSAEDTSSSMMYLLDSGNNSSSLSESDDQQNKMLTSHPMNMMPPWKCNIRWSTALEMNFKMPSMNTQQVMKSDRLFLQKMPQHPQVMQQVQELIDQSPSDECVLLDDDNLLGLSAKSTELKTKTCHLEQREEDQDQRSHDDQPSSAKESDMASLSDNGQSLTPKGESQKMMPACKDLIANVFVPMKFEKQTLSQSAWLKNTAFDTQVQMQYNKPQVSNVGDMLANDQAQLKSMDQPEMVHDQLDELMVQLKSQILQALTPLSPDLDDMDEDSGGLSYWGSNAQSSSESYHSEGKIFPYSCGESDSTTTDVCTSRVLGDIADNQKLEVESDKSDRSSEQATGGCQSDSVRDSATDSAALLGPMRNAPEGGGQSSEVDDTASGSVASQLLTDRQSVDTKSGSEARLTGTSDEGAHSDVGNSDVSMPLVSSCSVSPHSVGSVHSDNSAYSVSTIPSCCSPTVIIAEMETNPSDVTEDMDGSSEQAGETSGKESTILMMKDLFTCDENIMVIPE